MQDKFMKIFIFFIFISVCGFSQTLKLNNNVTSIDNVGNLTTNGNITGKIVYTDSSVMNNSVNYTARLTINPTSQVTFIANAVGWITMSGDDNELWAMVFFRTDELKIIQSGAKISDNGGGGDVWVYINSNHLTLENITGNGVVLGINYFYYLP